MPKPQNRSGSLRARLALASATGASALLAAGAAHAATYDVGPGRTFATLAQVQDRLAPGDVVQVHGGTHGAVTFTRHGAPDAKIRIVGVRQGGKRPVLSGGTNTIELAGNHYELEGLEVTGGAARCVYHHAHDVTIRDTLVRDCPKQGILGGDHDTGSLTLQHVEVRGCGEGTQHHQIYMATDNARYPDAVFRMEHSFVHSGRGGHNIKSRASRNEIYYNWIEGALHQELELIGSAFPSASVREDSDVVGNVIRKTRDSAIARIGGDGTGDTSGRYRFVNNTFIGSGGSTFKLYDRLESVEMHNNVFFRPGGGPMRIIHDDEVSWSAGTARIAGARNWLSHGATHVPAQWEATMTGDDPRFEDMSTLDLRPSAASPLVDVGVAGATGHPDSPFPAPLAGPDKHPPWRMCDGVGVFEPRSVAGAAIDIGAYEHGSSAGLAQAPQTGGGGGAGQAPPVPAQAAGPSSSDSAASWLEQFIAGL